DDRNDASYTGSLSLSPCLAGSWQLTPSQWEAAMKGKFDQYPEEPSSRALIQLRTMALFQRDPSGVLVYAPPPKTPQDRNPTVEERRLTRRFEYRQDARASTVTAQGKQDGQEVRTCDVSRGGCAILLEQPVKPGLFLDLRFEIPDLADRLPLAQ